MNNALTHVIRPATLLEPTRLARALGLRIVLAAETFQHTGSFKFRAAYKVAAEVSQKLVITASSGNFGQALAYACSLVAKRAIVVMPATSARVKIDAVREYGGQVDLVEVRVKSRAARVAELAAEHPEGYVASAYDDPLVIEGNSTLGEELGLICHGATRFDCVLAPVGGGGLSSGIICGLRRVRVDVPVIGAEPLLANDAARSLAAGHIVVNESEPQTIADGARTLSLGRHNWEILKDGLARIIEVPEEKIGEAVRLLFALANLKVEPTGALAVAAVLTEPAAFLGQTVCCVVSGGNVDPEVYRRVLAG